MTEGSLEVKLTTIWRDGKAEVGRVREEKSRSEKIRERGLKSNLAKAAGAEPAGQMRDEKLHAVVARSHFAVEHVSSAKETPWLPSSTYNLV